MTNRIKMAADCPCQRFKLSHVSEINLNAVMRRAAQDRSGLAQAQRKLAGAILPDDIRAAQDRLNIQQRAVGLAMRTRDNAAAEQNLLEMEDTLAVIEKFIRTTTILSRPQTAR
jgi:hypothetical protein